MIIAASTEAEQHQILEQVLRGVKVNPDKVQFMADKVKYKVKYMGHIISIDGLQPNDTKVLAITVMSHPTVKKGLQCLLGTI